MPGKKIKNWQTSNFIGFQDRGGDFNQVGFPLFCFVICNEEEPRNFFAKELFHEKDKVIFLPENTDWEQIAVETEFMSSRNDARKNNFKGKIPNGWHEVAAGKGIDVKFIYIFKHVEN